MISALPDQERLDAAVYWQLLARQGLLHPLSCRSSAEHRPLEPQAIDKGEPLLVCADCGYATYIPERVVHIWRALKGIGGREHRT